MCCIRWRLADRIRRMMKITFRQRLAAFYMVGLVVLATAGRALAGDGYEAPEVEDASSLAAYFLAGLSLVAVLFAAFHNPKRSHLEED